MTNVTEIKQKTKQIIKKHKSNKSALIAVLQDIQEAFNYLPKEALKTASNMMKVPMSRVYEAATFYTAFSLKPRGKHIVKICKGTACHVRGAAILQDRFETTLGIKPGETTKDGKFSLETVNCVGACALGPVVVINTDYHGQVTINKVDKIIKKINNEEGAQQ
ncbi:MAG: NADP-reducing hydrogenase subunit HndA [Deltaproteobacteria bacterium ADurb.Bin151]|jgi:NADH-quinone oxidoreductase subunit E|nr:NADH-quinone oxidoreductase subunit NuoE [Smithella sp.]OQB51638.1 MAG: NADP-reducing hydrogenase subunit HndA [Deltaproteobacteria bacterium ADurb.Bin151]HNZ11828.1 NADH-quinone oxidoreductase subunit NuoE [Smithellaceae bacterium]HOG82593.1 NADH-quinone oxidoreductase subunit NuoE [Smithellaceae bacterium]HOQ42133.1 NADH-quinone oxidoreductase subunit NuoE [Smithellaceae bacterium]